MNDTRAHLAQEKIAERRRHVTLRAVVEGTPGVTGTDWEQIVETNDVPAVRLVMARGSLLAAAGGRWRPISRLTASYALHRAEDRFARDLLTFTTQYWLFRTHQQSRLGDFIALDRSSAATAPARCFAIELKRSTPLRLWRRGIQLAECDTAVRWVAHQTDSAAVTAIPVVGDAASVLELLRSGAAALESH